MFSLSRPLSSQAASLLSSRASAASLGFSPLRPSGFGRDDKLDQIRAPVEMTRRVAPPNALFTDKLPPENTGEGNRIFLFHQSYKISILSPNPAK